MSENCRPRGRGIFLTHTVDKWAWTKWTKSVT